MVDDSGAQPLPRRVPGASGSPRPPVAVERAPIPEDLRQRVLAAIAVEVERDRAEAVRSAQEQGGNGERAEAGGPAGTRERPALGVLRRGGKRAVAGELAGAGEPVAAGNGETDQRGSAGLESAGTGADAGTGPDVGTMPDAGTGADAGTGLDRATPVAGVPLTGGSDTAGAAGQPETAEVNAAGSDGAALADSPWFTDVFGGTAEAGQTETAEAGVGGSDGAALGSAWFTDAFDGTGDAGRAPAPGLADGATVVDGSWLTDGATRADDTGLAGEAGQAAGLDYGIIADPAGYTAAPGPGSGPEDGAAGEPPLPEAAGAGEAAAGPDVTLPRRAPGENGAPPPPAHLRREYLPPSLLGRQLDPEAHTEPIPRISGFRPDDPAGPAGSWPTSAWTFADIAPSSGQAPPEVAAPPAGPGPSAPPERPEAEPADPAGPASGGPSAAAPALAAAAAPPEAGPAPADSAPAAPVRKDDPPHPAGPTAGAPPAQSPPTSWLAASPGGPTAATTPPATSLSATAPPGTVPPGPAPSGSAPSGSAPSGSAPSGSEPPAPGPASSELAPYPWPPGDEGTRQDNGGPHARNGQALPGNGRATGTTARPPASRPLARPATPKASSRRHGGRPYRIAGLVLSVVALVAGGTVALVMSGGTGSSGHHAGPGVTAPGTGAAVRDRAVAWVASQVSRTAVVACDPVFCQALRADGLPASGLYQLGARTTSPLRAQVIVATAPVRDQFGSLLGSVYAPGVLASFGSGASRIDIRLIAPHGAAAYRAVLRSALLNRRAAGTELLRSGRITVTAVARRELAAGQVDGRLLVAIAQMAAAHPMYIVDFGVAAPGASAGLPLRQADIAEDAHAHRHPGRVASAGYVRAMVSFLRAQRGQFRPGSVRSLRLPGGVAVLRIMFTAPSPLGLLGPHG